MKDTQKSAFSKRLIRAMRESEVARKSGTKHGVDAAALQRVANVSREMARRYLEGLAIPNPDPMKAIADWLDIRVAWLRDGEEPMRHDDLGEITVRGENGTYTVLPQDNVIIICDEAHRQLNRAYKQLDDDDKKQLLALAKRLAFTATPNTKKEATDVAPEETVQSSAKN